MQCSGGDPWGVAGRGVVQELRGVFRNVPEGCQRFNSAGRGMVPVCACCVRRRSRSLWNGRRPSGRAVKGRGGRGYAQKQPPFLLLCIRLLNFSEYYRVGLRLLRPAVMGESLPRMGGSVAHGVERVPAVRYSGEQSAKSRSPRRVQDIRTKLHAGRYSDEGCFILSLRVDIIGRRG